MLNLSEYLNDEMSQLLHETACLFEVDISHPFSPDITYQGFIDEYRVKIQESSRKYKKIKNEPAQLPYQVKPKFIPNHILLFFSFSIFFTRSIFIT